MTDDTARASNEWGRVDSTGAVYVRIGDEERLVGEFPDATPEEALAFFVRRYEDLEGQVALLEQRAKRGAPAQDVAKAARHLAEAVENAHAVGDLAGLAARLQALQGTIEQLTEAQIEAQKAQLEAAIAEREAIVVEMEQLAAQDLDRVQWKVVGAQTDELFARWQAHQATGPHLPKSVADALWKRFSSSRSKIDSARRAFFAQMDAQHKEARAAKLALIEKAEALVPKGSEGIPAYRALLDQWKSAGRAGKRVDDQLWERFKAAGDALYQAKAEEMAREDSEYAANLEVKLALLTEAEQILELTDRKKARDLLTDIQRRWDAAGRVPRDHVRSVEDRLRKVEAHVRRLDEEHWRATNPERKERSEGFAGQLQESIAKLERELEAAKQAGDTKAIEQVEQALATQKAWLAAIG